MSLWIREFIVIRLECDRCNRDQVLDGKPDYFAEIPPGITPVNRVHHLCPECVKVFNATLTRFWKDPKSTSFPEGTPESSAS